MASGETRMKIAREAQKYETILWLTKSCELSDICNIWKHWLLEDPDVILLSKRNKNSMIIFGMDTGNEGE
nr:hypothetical protein [Tanacetum cinerariifolium]